MKNIIHIKNAITTLSILFISLVSINAQFIETKMHLQFSYGKAFPIGNKNVTDGEFVIPSLFTNFSNNYSLTGRATYKFYPYLSFGAEYKQTNYNNWSYSNSEDLYNNSSATISSIGVLAKVHSRHVQNGIFNRIQSYYIISPALCQTNISLKNAIYYMEGNNNDEDNELTRESRNWGINMYAGIIYSITQSFSFYAEAGLLTSRLKSQLCNDKYVKTCNLNFGICFQLKKEKHLYL